MTESLIRVVLAEDSPTVRHHLTRVINEVPGLKVIGEARDGQEAIEMVQALKPQVVSMDIRMPRMDGLEATRQIMAQQPTPIVVVSGLLDEEIDLAFRALQAGALAVVEKPPARHEPSFGAKQRQLANTLVAMANVKVIRRWDNAPGRNGSHVREVVEHTAVTARVQPEILAIGASAGGPSALGTLLNHLPADLPIPVVIVQHISEEFVGGLARWLAKNSRLPIQIAADQTTLTPGVVYLSPGNAHTSVVKRGKKLLAHLIGEQGSHRYRPSVNVLMQSVATACGPAGIGVLLTGMGDDGAAGLLAMRRAGALTLVQDKTTCTVFGMPSAALELGAAEKALPPDQLAQMILQTAV
jgi:two-component system chemotaxis response regulator CheB